MNRVARARWLIVQNDAPATVLLAAPLRYQGAWISMVGNSLAAFLEGVFPCVVSC
jgi:hypothetical protein